MSNIPINDVNSMNEQLHTDCSILRNKLSAVLPINIKWSIKVRGPDFFKQIIQRYSIVTRSDRFPSLILLKLLENASGTTKLTNVNKNNIKKILNTNIRQYLNLYVTIQSRENVIVPDLYFNNALSSGRHVPEQQVNIRTDIAKNTKHVVISRLMRYLQQIDDQESGYGFLPASAKILATTELVRTLPKRMVYNREKSENTVLFSNNSYLESDIRIIKHTLQPVMARTSQEKTQYQNSVGSKNISLSKKYPDKGDIQTDFTKERSENTVLFSNNPYAESDIRIIKHTLQPAMARTTQGKTQYQNSVGSKNISLSKKYPDKDDNFVSADIDKIQASGIQIEKTGNFSELQHLKMPDIPLFDEYTNPVVADISRVEVSENTKARDIIGHSLTHMEEKIPEIDTIMTHIQKRNKQVYEKHNFFHRRTADRYLVTEKNNIANKLISNTNIARSRMADIEAEAGEVTEIPKENPSQKTPKLLFDQDGIFLQHAGHAQTGMSAPLNFSSNNIVGRSSGLVLRRPTVHSAEKGFENTKKPDIIKTEITKINAEKEDIIGTNIKVRDSIDDIATITTIATIADEVYKLLETRISIEKERRGLR